MSVGPLAGITVVECASFISGPYAGLLLAQLGARVIKVEAPDSGDPFRRSGGAGGRRRTRPQFAALNYGKESVAIDLRSAPGRERYLDLVAEADALVENFRPGVLDRFGVGEQAVRRRKPVIVYCSLTGFGSSGPYAQRPAYDAIVQALSGLWGLLSPLSDPRAVGPAMSDTIAGLNGALAVVAGLAGVQRWPEAPTRFEVSMLASSLSFLGTTLANFGQTGEVESPHSRARRSQSYAWRAADGAPFAVHLSSPDKFWVRFTDVIGRHDLRADERFGSYAARLDNYHLLVSELAPLFMSEPRAHWLQRLTQADVPAARSTASTKWLRTRTYGQLACSAKRPGRRTSRSWWPAGPSPSTATTVCAR